MPTTIAVHLDIPIKRIQDLLCSAFEGGSNYWYRIDRFVKPSEFTDYTWKLDKPGQPQTVFRHIDYPTNPGGALIISDKEGDPTYSNKTLDLEACRRGLEVMRTKASRHFADFLAENDDAETGDVYLQCCIFGEVVFG